MNGIRINARKKSPCGWAVEVNGKILCSQNPSPENSDPNNPNCPTKDNIECARCWAEMYECPALRQKGMDANYQRRR